MAQDSETLSAVGASESTGAAPGDVPPAPFVRGGRAVCAAIAGMCREAALLVSWSEIDDEAFERDAFEIVGDFAFESIDELPLLVAPEAVAVCDPSLAQTPSDEARSERGASMEVGGTRASDGFATFTRILEEVLLAQGAGPQAALILGALLGESRLEGRALPPATEQAIVDGRLATRGVRGLTRTPELGAQIVAWQAFLRGETDEVGAVVTSTLDEWAAGLVSRVMGEAHRAPAIRCALRERGVAAFGLVADAA